MDSGRVHDDNEDEVIFLSSSSSKDIGGMAPQAANDKMPGKAKESYNRANADSKRLPTQFWNYLADL